MRHKIKNKQKKSTDRRNPLSHTETKEKSLEGPTGTHKSPSDTQNNLYRPTDTHNNATGTHKNLYTPTDTHKNPNEIHKNPYVPADKKGSESHKNLYIRTVKPPTRTPVRPRDPKNTTEFLRKPKKVYKTLSCRNHIVISRK